MLRPLYRCVIPFENIVKIASFSIEVKDAILNCNVFIMSKNIGFMSSGRSGTAEIQ